ncbi:MAG: Hsp70 family protein [Verrucomicrobiae bacterium]|nr:Hsp70 family protein [Verrucomicrobiae bacterium]
MTMKGFGIDFGTTNSLIAYYNTEIAEMPGAFMDAGRPHPSLVWYRPDSSQPVVGWEARRQMNQVENTMGHCFVHSVKRLMAEEREVPIIGTTRKPAREVGADILSHLLNHARKTLPVAAEGLHSCVATVPVNSSGRYRRELRRAIELAGLQVESFTHEPFAAVFGWFFAQKTDLHHLRPMKVLVFDWGGGTLDITLVQVQDGRIFELGNSNLEHCAGNEFTDKLIGLVRDRFVKRTGLRVDKLILDAEAKDRVWVNVEDAKIKLSADADAQVNVPNYTFQEGNIYDLSETVARPEYEELIKSDVDAAKAKVYECLHRAGVEAGSVDLVLLIGGTSRTPLVHQMMREIFVTKVVPVKDADSIIAKGAAVIAAHKWKPYLVKPVTVKLADKSFLPLFKHGQTLAAPLASKSFTFYCVDGRNGSAHLLFYEQQRPNDAAIQKSLNCNLLVPTARTVLAVSDLDRIMVNCYVTEDLTIKVEAMSSSQGKREAVEIQDICYGLEIA